MKQLSTASFVLVSAVTLVGCAFEGAEPEEVASVAQEVSNCAGFSLSSPDVKKNGVLPDSASCEGKPFGAGISPLLHWDKGPAGTQSYAILLKDLSIESGEASDTDPEHPYHWAIWNIPKNQRTLTKNIPHKQFPYGPTGPEQLNGGPPFLNPNAYFGPCPSLGTFFSGGAVPPELHKYAFTIYALPSKITQFPDYPEFTNPIRDLDAYLESGIALAKARLVVTSDAVPNDFGVPVP